MSETPYRIEPCLLDDPPPALVERGRAIRDAAQRLGVDLHADTAESLAHAVRIADTRYSHLIEKIDVAPEILIDANWSMGHLDHPPDVLACAAHVRERWRMDQHYRPADNGKWSISWRAEELHRSVFSWTGDEMAGRFRSEPSHDVSVGVHLPPASEAVARFVAHLEARTDARRHATAAAVSDIAAVHHRFAYVHPFVDGNGRMARLLSWDMIGQADLRGRCLWSLSRGLCGPDRGFSYLRAMDAADATRRGDLDGRGNLSLKALVEFCGWFLDVMEKEIAFAADLASADALEARLLAAASALGLGEDAIRMARRTFRTGSFRFATTEANFDAIESLRRHGFLWLAKEGPLTGLHLLRFPLPLRHVLLPGLFDTPGDGITDLETNLLSWWEMDRGARSRC